MESSMVDSGLKGSNSVPNNQHYKVITRDVLSDGQCTVGSVGDV